MTFKLIIVYRRPDDQVGFLQHYHDVHLSLVMKVSFLMRTVFNWVDKMQQLSSTSLTLLRVWDGVGHDTKSSAGSASSV